MDTTTEVWTWAKPYIRDGQLTQAEVTKAIQSYKHGSAGAAGRIIRALKDKAEGRRSVPWYEYWPIKLGIRSSEFFLLVHLWEKRTLPEIHRRMNRTDFEQALFWLEKRDWLSVKRSKSDAILALKLTEQAPQEPTNMREGYLNELS